MRLGQLEENTGAVGDCDITLYSSKGTAYLTVWRRLFIQSSNFENVKPKKKSIQRSISENKGFEKKVNDTIWQESSKPENDSHIRRLCQLKDLKEDDFLLNNNIHTLQGEKLQGISYQMLAVRHEYF
ncbi:putative uncharacterized protein ENSP00000383407 [Pteropus medius]|uniref:putative uncharacterized protein ENSP00000383407 n=1 Tax=Pteropus vampyrus TaxID=132908 RepID=UPI00196AC93D|nr:putative uncharacterized protein ENSP00000383407 [Pteropus giganteus]